MREQGAHLDHAMALAMARKHEEQAAVLAVHHGPEIGRRVLHGALRTCAHTTSKDSALLRMQKCPLRWLAVTSEFRSMYFPSYDVSADDMP